MIEDDAGQGNVTERKATHHPGSEYAGSLRAKGDIGIVRLKFCFKAFCQPRREFLHHNHVGIGSTDLIDNRVRATIARIQVIGQNREARFVGRRIRRLVR